MRTRIIPFLAACLTATSLQAEGIRYDRIPADAVSYFQFDVDRLVHTAAFRKAPNSDEILHQITGIFANNSDITLYETHSPQSPHADKADGFVLLWHSPAPGFKEGIQTALAAAKGNLAITYDQQAITFTDTPATHLLTPAETSAPATMPASAPEKSETAAPPPPPPPHSRFMLGLGDSQSINPDKGPSYVAFVGPDLLVISGDLRSMGEAIDVIHGKRPSLAQQDPNGLKFTPPAGTCLIATGLSAEFQNQNDAKPSATQPATDIGGALGLDMFGTLKAKAHIARFDLGENQQALFADASITMNDEEAAMQLKRLVVGVKGLIGLTQPQFPPLLEPLEVESLKKEVSLHWSWPVAKLGDLYALLASEGDHADAGSSTRPSN